MLAESFSIENAKPTDTAISKLRPILHNNIRPQPNAVAVLNITMGLRTGAASKKAMPAGRGSPFRKRRRASGTVPHSQMGKINPSDAPTNAAGRARRGAERANQSSERKTSTNPDDIVPINKNGRASINIPKKTVANTESRCPSHGHVEEGRLV